MVWWAWRDLKSRRKALPRLSGIFNTVLVQLFLKGAPKPDALSNPESFPPLSLFPLRAFLFLEREKGLAEPQARKIISF